MGESDMIVLRGLRVRGNHGVLPEERSNGQIFVIDAVLSVDVTMAAQSDNLADTIDYAALAQRLAAIVEGEPVDLIETLAARLVAECLTDRRVQHAEVTVHKPEAPVGLPVDDIAVTVSRGRK
ncbi:MAG: 7,8-dihydroneopterin aldolase/epimerase/oxygenase [Frankiales bacterium]|jgi:dihydroneopterin aldolase|nr:7,8-dihydroneopterin aldolase/epimerase/oxygenase [Frankiales bacterium]